jgi:hypothetical protein
MNLSRKIRKEGKDLKFDREEKEIYFFLWKVFHTVIWVTDISEDNERDHKI